MQRSLTVSLLIAGVLALRFPCLADDPWRIVLQAGHPTLPAYDVLWVGAGQGASDLYDSDDLPRTRPDGPINLAAYHRSTEGWSGPEGFYGMDLHAPVAGESTWANIYLWWGAPFQGLNFPLYIQPDPHNPLPSGFRSVLYLDQVPAGVTYGGPWSWNVPMEGLGIPAGTFTPFESSTGLDSYRFHYTVLIPEPGGIVVLAGGLSAVCFGLRRSRLL